MSVNDLRFTVLLVAGLLVWALGLFDAKAQHPTAVTSVVNSAEDTTLEVNYNGSLLAPGTFDPGVNNDSIPTEGAGTRLMWYPAKAAFRAGRMPSQSIIYRGTSWDAPNVGTYSVAFGVDTKASGVGAMAVGERTTASGPDGSVALGVSTTASAAAATAMGTSTTASGAHSLAIGALSTASGRDAVATGLMTTAATRRSLSVGECNSANSGSSGDGTLLVVGNGTFSSGACDDRSDALALDESGNLTTAGNVNGSSDRRLKKSIESLEEGVLQKLAGLRPVRYEFKDQQTRPSGEQIGLIAQDVRKEFPELVSEGPEGYLSLAYPKMTALLLKGLQEQQATIQRQRAGLEEKEAKIAELEAENEAMRTRQREIEKRLAALEAKGSPSVVAGLTGSGGGLLLAFLLGGLVGAGLLWRRRA